MKCNIKEIKNISQQSPVILIGGNKSDFEEYVVISSNISSKNMGIVRTEKGLKVPKWFYEIKTNPNLLICDLDKIDKYEQQKFVELLKYREISNMPIANNCSIVLLANDQDKLNENIKSYCLLIKGE